MSFSCKRDAHFEKIKVFSEKEVQEGFWSDFGAPWEPLGAPLGPRNR